MWEKTCVASRSEESEGNWNRFNYQILFLYSTAVGGLLNDSSKYASSHTSSPCLCILYAQTILNDVENGCTMSLPLVYVVMVATVLVTFREWRQLNEDT